MPYSPQLADRVRRVLNDAPGASEKAMFGGLAFLHNGHMVCGVNGKDLMVRVGPAAYEAALHRPGAREMDFTGRPMRGLVFVDEQALAQDAALRAWIELALRFVRELPPKQIGRRP